MQEFVIDRFGLCWLLPEHSDQYFAIDVNRAAIATNVFHRCININACYVKELFQLLVIMIEELLSCACCLH